MANRKEIISRLHPWLRFDPEVLIREITDGIRRIVSVDLAKKGTVVAVSGGIDSAACAALATASLGPDRVMALLLPETDSASESRQLGEILAKRLGIRFEVQEITGVLEALGCYRLRDEAIRAVVPEFGPGWKSKVVISRFSQLKGGFNFHRIVAESPGGNRIEKRLPLREYLQIVAATNYKQRVRKTIEYFHADRLNYAVVGTPNLLEYDQGFFVKNGDGSADLKPIAHLYKSQVYAVAACLDVPEPILAGSPSTDTYSLPQGQDEFFFALPYQTLDLVMYGLNHGIDPDVIASETGLERAEVDWACRDILGKRRTTRFLHAAPLLIS